MPPLVKWDPNPLYRQVDHEIAARMHKCGEMMVRKAKGLAPVRSGQLEASIRYEYHPAEHELTLVADAKHAIFVEFGTVHMMARPFLRPAMSEAAAVWGGSVPNLGLSFTNAPHLKSQVANPTTSKHRGNQAYNRAVSEHYNRGNIRHAKQYIRSRRGGPGS